MRSKNRNIFAVLVTALAVLAPSAAGAVSASAALPEFTGTFPNTVKISGLSNISVQTESGGMTCALGSASGKITGAKAATIKLTFTGCSFAGHKCSTAGAAAGEIRTGELPSAPVYISKATKEVAFDLNKWEPLNEEPKPQFAAYKCEGTVVAEGFRGALMSPITATNTKTKSFALKYSYHNYTQIPAQFENEQGKKVTNDLEESFLNENQYFEAGVQTSGTPKLETSLETELKA